MPKKLPIAMAEGDDDYGDDNMIDGGNSQIRLQELLLRLLDWLNELILPHYNNTLKQKWSIASNSLVRTWLCSFVV